MPEQHPDYATRAVGLSAALRDLAVLARGETGGEETSTDAVEVVTALLFRFVAANLGYPEILQTIDGGLSLQFEFGTITVRVTVAYDGSLHYRSFDAGIKMDLTEVEDADALEVVRRLVALAYISDPALRRFGGQ
jgi:hypothetical protein